VELTDSPTDAQEYKLSVKPGDVVVMASDGLWDNCFSDEIASIVDINVSSPYWSHHIDLFRSCHHT
jgi:serine/threonine protein phosphatase PrpC